MREIPRELAESQRMPDDLDSSARGPYRIPSPRRRRSAGILYLAGALVAAGLTAVGLPAGMWWVAAGLGLLGLYHFLSAWELGLHEEEALGVAAPVVDFPIGHASAALGFRGWRARPVWNVLLFSADDPPSRRALVGVDAVSGEVLDRYIEEVPAP